MSKGADMIEVKTNIIGELSKNPLNELQSDVSKILKSLNEDNLSFKFHNNALTQTDKSLLLFYGLPKIHKANVPLRPIVSGVNSRNFSLAKVLYNKLKNSIIPPASHINNSFELKEKITIFPETVLLSLDVSALYTNVPCNLVIQIFDKPYQNIISKCDIPYSEVIEITKFLFICTFFKFDGKFFHQIFGTSMGSPISPLFADIWLDGLEEGYLNTLKENIIVMSSSISDK